MDNLDRAFNRVFSAKILETVEHPRAGLCTPGTAWIYSDARNS